MRCETVGEQFCVSASKTVHEDTELKIARNFQQFLKNQGTTVVRSQHQLLVLYLRIYIRYEQLLIFNFKSELDIPPIGVKGMELKQVAYLV